MDPPVTSDAEGVKLRPEMMEEEKLYHCIHGDKAVLLFKDSEGLYNCYEIEDADLVERIRTCGDDLEAVLEEYVRGLGDKDKGGGGVPLSELEAPSDAEDILSERGSDPGVPDHTECPVPEPPADGAGGGPAGDPHDDPHDDPQDDPRCDAPTDPRGDPRDDPHDDPPSGRDGSPDRAPDGGPLVVGRGKSPSQTIKEALDAISESGTVTLRGTDRDITKAVDISQMMLRRMSGIGYAVSGVRTYSVPRMDGGHGWTSAIEIDISSS